MWAEDSDEEERPTMGFGRGPRRKKDYATPVSFISGGVKQGTKISKEEGIDEEEVRLLNVFIQKCLGYM